MATSKIESRQIIFEILTATYNNAINGFGFNVSYSAPSGYTLVQPLLVKTANDNWIFGHATKVNDTTISVSGQNTFNGAISGQYKILCIYEKQ
jgi:hypothetical protein